MRRFVISSFVVLATMISTGILVQKAQAFTLLPGLIVFDPVSLSPNQSLHIHAYPFLISNFIEVGVRVAPTDNSVSPGVTIPVIGAGPGAGAEFKVAYAQFQTTTAPLPVVVVVAVGPSPGNHLPNDWSARVSSSVEVFDDTTNLPTTLVTHRHISTNGNPCNSCQ